MSRLRVRVTAIGFLTVLVLGMTVVSFGQRYTRAETIVRMENHSDIARVVRLTDGTSGRIIDTVRLDPWTNTVAAGYRTDRWWQDVTAEELAAGLDGGIRLELLGDGCELLAAAGYYDGDGATLLDGSSAFYTGDSGDEGRVLQHREGPSISTPDPCGGSPAPPVGRIANVTGVPIVVDGRVVVPACSVATVHPGDLSSPPDPAAGSRATPVTVPSVAVQQERWPIQPITVTVSRASVDDWPEAILAPDLLDGCGGKPLEDYESVYDEPYVPYVPPVPPVGG